MKTAKSLSCLSVLIVVSTGCAEEPNQPRNVGQGCTGSARNSPACRSLSSSSQTAGNGNSNTPDKSSNSGLSPEEAKRLAKLEAEFQATLEMGKSSAKPPTQNQPSSIVSQPAANPNPIDAGLQKAVGDGIQKVGEAIFDRLGNLISGGGGGGAENSSSTAANTGSKSGSITLSAKVSTFIKTGTFSATQMTGFEGVDYCRITLGDMIKVACLQDSTSNHYYVTGAGICSGITKGYIDKNDVTLVNGSKSSACR